MEMRAGMCFRAYEVQYGGCRLRLLLASASGEVTPTQRMSLTPWNILLVLPSVLLV